MRLNCGDTCPKTGSYNVVDAQGNVVNTIYVGAVSYTHLTLPTNSRV